MDIEKMQQFGRSIIPVNAVPVRGSMAWWLNRRERVTSVLPGVKTLPNSPEEHLLSGKAGQDSRVPVVNMRGGALMPTTAQKARKLLKKQKAKIFRKDKI